MAGDKEGKKNKHQRQDTGYIDFFDPGIFNS